MRGFFYQPAKVKLKVNEQRKATGFFTEPGLSYIEGFWRHPHTPIGIKKEKKKKSGNLEYYHISISKDKPLWTQMLGFLYAQAPNQEGYARALVVDHYIKGIGNGKHINLSVGGYIGTPPETLLSRKHEIYTLKSGWDKKYFDIKELVECALNTQKVLNTSIYVLGKNLKEEDGAQGQEKSNFIKKQLQPLARQIYFNNSESLIHETLRNLDFNKIQAYKKKFSDLAKNTFKETTQSYEHDPKLLKAIEYGRKYLNGNLKKLLEI